VPGPEIALAGAVVLLAIFVILSILFLLITSLVITTTLEKNGSQMSACGVFCWSLVGIQFCWQQGKGTIYFSLLDRTLWSKNLPRERAIPSPAVIKKTSVQKAFAWKSLVPEFLTALGYLGRHLRIKTISANATVGFPSAPATGMMYGYFHAGKGMLSPVSIISLHLTPDFNRTICDGRFSCSIEVRYPLIFAFCLLRIGIRRNVRNVLFHRGGMS
jgi:hypothetical protein